MFFCDWLPGLAVMFVGCARPVCRTPPVVGCIAAHASLLLGGVLGSQSARLRELRLPSHNSTDWRAYTTDVHSGGWKPEIKVSQAGLLLRPLPAAGKTDAFSPGPQGLPSVCTHYLVSLWVSKLPLRGTPGRLAQGTCEQPLFTRPSL